MRVPSLAYMRKTKQSAGSLPLFNRPGGAVEAMPDFSFHKDSSPDYRFERFLTDQGFEAIAGTDEAGRGPLAGPVVAAAVILPMDANIEGLNDSKKLSIKKRDALFDAVMETALAISVTAMSAETIDHTDIRKASLEAMRRSLVTLSICPDAVLVDGRDIPIGLPADLSAHALIKGDGRSMSIAAAAIVAKVSRDRMMAQLGCEIPAYGLESHMGYGSAHHRAKIMEIGGTERVHRYSFRPLSAFHI